MTDHLDPYISRKLAASEISQHLFPVTERALRDWKEPRTAIIAGRACARRSEWLDAARQHLVEACHRHDLGRDLQLARARAARRPGSRSRRGVRSPAQAAE